MPLREEIFTGIKALFCPPQEKEYTGKGEQNENNERYPKRGLFSETPELPGLNFRKMDGFIDQPGDQDDAYNTGKRHPTDQYPPRRDPRVALLLRLPVVILHINRCWV